MTSLEDETPIGKVAVLGDAYPVPVMLQDISSADAGPFTQGIFIGVNDNTGAERVFISCNHIQDVAYLVTKLQAWLLQEI